MKTCFYYILSLVSFEQKIPLHYVNSYPKITHENGKDAWQTFNEVNILREKGISKYAMMVRADQFRDADESRAGTKEAWHMLEFPVIHAHDGL